MKHVREIFEAITGLIGVVTPIASTFSVYVPPLFPEIGYIAAVLSMGIIYFGYKGNIGPNTQQKAIKLGVVCLLIGTLLIVCYIILFSASTVNDPATSKVRYQIGFQKADFSLTETGKKLKQAFGSLTIQQWMEKAAAFRDGGPEIIWKSITVYLAGGLLICLYFACFIFWSLGFALMARYYALKNHTPM